MEVVACVGFAAAPTRVGASLLGAAEGKSKDWLHLVASSNPSWIACKQNWIHPQARVRCCRKDPGYLRDKCRRRASRLARET